MIDMKQVRERLDRIIKWQVGSTGEASLLAQQVLDAIEQGMTVDIKAAAVALVRENSVEPDCLVENNEGILRPAWELFINDAETCAKTWGFQYKRNEESGL